MMMAVRLFTVTAQGNLLVNAPHACKQALFNNTGDAAHRNYYRTATAIWPRVMD